MELMAHCLSEGGDTHGTCNSCSLASQLHPDFVSIPKWKTCESEIITTLEDGPILSGLDHMGVALPPGCILPPGKPIVEACVKNTATRFSWSPPECPSSHSPKPTSYTLFYRANNSELEKSLPALTNCQATVNLEFGCAYIISVRAESEHFVSKRSPELFLELTASLPAIWMDTEDGCHGFRQWGESPLWLALAKDHIWDFQKQFQPPEGFHWASLSEFEAVKHKCNKQHAYLGVTGWSTYRRNGREKYCWVFCDTVSTGKFIHTGGGICLYSLDEVTIHGVCGGIQIKKEPGKLPHFAGIVCIKDQTSPSTKD